MTDLETTKACAEAAGYFNPQKASGVNFNGVWAHIKDDDPADNGGVVLFNPLHDDAQAMALVKRLGLEIWRRVPPHCWNVAPMDYSIDWVIENDDLNRAICECVAKMQRKRHD